jgi:hypothetical protein
MSTTKRISGTYTIQSINSTDNININTNQLTINGNLLVIGNTTTIDTNQVNLFYSNIMLNTGVSPSSPANPIGAYIFNDRGTTGANVAIRWNETSTAWQFTNDGVTYNNIGSTSLTANLDIKNYTIYSSTVANVAFDSNISIKNTTTAPPAVSGYNVLYAQTPNSGGSGLYVTNSTATDELATKSAAIKYSIIFG